MEHVRCAAFSVQKRQLSASSLSSHHDVEFGTASIELCCWFSNQVLSFHLPRASGDRRMDGWTGTSGSEVSFLSFLTLSHTSLVLYHPTSSNAMQVDFPFDRAYPRAAACSSNRPSGATYKDETGEANVKERRRGGHNERSPTSKTVFTLSDVMSGGPRKSE